MLAAALGNLTGILELVKEGADVDSYDESMVNKLNVATMKTALMEAAEHGQDDIIEALLNASAVVNLTTNVSIVILLFEKHSLMKNVHRWAEQHLCTQLKVGIQAV